VQEFPSTRAILAELVDQESFTREGQRAKAEHLVDFANRWGLGNARLVEYPDGAKHANESPKPCNVLIEIEPTQSTLSREHLLVVNHFDTVPPVSFPSDIERTPHQLFPSRSDPDVCYAVGAYDDLQGVTANLVAAHQLQQRNDVRHHVSFLLVSGEEDESQGIHAALHPDQDLTRNATCCVSNDIPVGAHLGDPAVLGVGRQGRVGIQIVLRGAGMHSGRYKPQEDGRLIASTLDGYAKIAIPQITFPERPEPQFRHLMPPSYCAARKWSSVDPHSLSIPAESTIDLDVLYGNPELDEPAIIDHVRRSLEEAFSRNGLPPDSFYLKREADRSLPFTKPFLESPDHTFVRTVQRIMGQVVGKAVALQVFRGTADEPIVVHRKKIPAVIFAADGDGEHTGKERVRVSSIDQRVVPTLVALATHDGPLTRE
jgi:acetylornithine deacetylase/succinyl-diaminopimelate desuccinylase-like protein